MTTAVMMMMAAGADAQGAQPAAKDEIAGMSRERLARIAPVMKEQIDKGLLLGAVTLVARRGTIVHYETRGFPDAQESKPMTTDALRRLASMTNPIVAI